MEFWGAVALISQNQVSMSCIKDYEKELRVGLAK
jgi:hypothetical protein